MSGGVRLGEESTNCREEKSVDQLYRTEDMANKMTINVNMLPALMKNWIMGSPNSILIITSDRCIGRKSNVPEVGRAPPSA